MIRALAVVVLILGVRGDVRAEPTSFADAVKATAAPIGVHDNQLTGAGAATLKRALDAANFVMLGEDHGIAQIPTLAAAMCAELAPHGFHRLALEVGASVAPTLEQLARAPVADGVKHAAELVAKYPETIAFYDWCEELAFLQACAKATAAQPLQIWGLDQELVGATGFVLQRILDTKPGPKATAAIEALREASAIARAAAAKTGDYGALYLLAAPQAKLDAARAALAADGNPEARELFDGLLQSRAIYQGQAGDAPYLSNRKRARRMKEAFLDDLSAAAKQDRAFPKVFLKLGAYHLYRGLNPLRSSEIGNLVAEAAEGHKVEAVNVLALGVKGQSLHPAGVGRAPAPGAVDLAGDPDSPYRVLAPFFAAQVAKSWTLFDLRALRPRFGKLGKVDPELERLVFGYDFLVLIPDPRAQHGL